MKKYKFLFFLLFGLFFLFPKNTYAYTVYAEKFDTQSFQIDEETGWLDINSNFNNYWRDKGSGVLHFTFSLTKTAGDSVSETQILRGVNVSIGFATYPCDIGTMNTANSTWTNQVYSASCPVTFYGGAGLHHLNFNFAPNRYNGISSAGYFLFFHGFMSFEQFDDNNSLINDNQNTDKIIVSQSEIKKEQEKTNQKLDELNKNNKETNNYLKDDNINESQSSADDFFNNFNQNSHGLSGIITAPLVTIQNLTTSHCTPLKFTLPIVNNEVVLPCMKGIYEEHFGIFFSLWQLLTTGLISYNVILNLYSQVRHLQNPKNDKIEVINL